MAKKNEHMTVREKRVADEVVRNPDRPKTEIARAAGVGTAVAVDRSLGKSSVQKYIQYRRKEQRSVGNMSVGLIKSVLMKFQDFVDSTEHGKLNISQKDLQLMGAMAKLGLDAKQADIESTEDAVEYEREQRIEAGMQIVRGVLAGVLFAFQDPTQASKLIASLPPRLLEHGVVPPSQCLYDDSEDQEDPDPVVIDAVVVEDNPGS